SAVLDLGCGEGYGASLLAQRAVHVVGLDVDPEAVDHAARKYGSEKCEFLPYDGNIIPFPDTSFDAITSFQVIEHIVDDKNYAAEAGRVLKSPGLFLVTTPNRLNRLKPGMKPWNRFHVREYSPEGLADVLRTGFADVQVMGIRATDAVQQMELTRVKQNLKIASLDPLNLRWLLPEPVIPAVIRLLRRLIYRDPADAPGQDFTRKYGIEEFFVIREGLADSLDLLAVCRK
ncbi:MAG TPA: class I SAM-dependent methyltransferase, partial [bacterium]|nr:class I SAM-dependent methyltransferase [bacterium]